MKKTPIVIPLSKVGLHPSNWVEAASPAAKALAEARLCLTAGADWSTRLWALSPLRRNALASLSASAATPARMLCDFRGDSYEMVVPPLPKIPWKLYFNVE